MQRILTNTSGGIAAALELVTTNIANPTELNAVGTAVPDWRLVRTNVAGTDQATLYRLDADTDAVSAPYVMASATAGLRWVAIAGAYLYGGANSMIAEFSASINAFAETNVQNLGSGTSVSSDSVVTANNGTSSTHYADFGINGSTGGAAPFTNANAAYLYTTDNELDICAQGASGFINFYLGATPNLIATFTSPTIASGAFTVQYTTASTSPVTGAVIIGGGSAATNVGIGGGAVFAGAGITSLVSVLAKPSATAGIQLDPNAATGNFTGALSPANLTAARRWTFPDASLVMSGSATALTSGRIPFATTGGVLTDSANLTFSTTVLNIANTTASSNSTNGSLTIGNGTAATTVGIGGGAIFAGGDITAIVNAQRFAKISGVNGSPSEFRLDDNSNVVIHKYSNGGLTGINQGIQTQVAMGDSSVLRATWAMFNIFTETVWTSTAGTQNASCSIQTVGAGVAVEFIRGLSTGAALFGSDPGGTDKVRINGALTINSAVMIQTKTAFTNGAAAALGTLTNAPVAGNPTKWVPINDNGTTRYIPCW